MMRPVKLPSFGELLDCSDAKRQLQRGELLTISLRDSDAACRSRGVSRVMSGIFRQQHREQIEEGGWEKPGFENRCRCYRSREANM
jgi:hypothetical protein